MLSTTPHFYERLSSLLWRLIVFGIVLLAVYVSLGRLLANHVDRYREPILERINQSIPGRLEVQGIALRWESFAPTLVLDEVVLHGDSGAMAGATIALASAELRIDVIASLQLRVPSISTLAVNGLQVEYFVPETPDIALSAESSNQSLQLMGDVLEVLMDKTRRIDVTDAQLGFERAGQRYLAQLDFDYWRDASERQLKVLLGDSTGTEIQVLAQGLGNPLRPSEFTGTGYVSMSVSQAPLAILRGQPLITSQQDAGFAVSMYLQALPNDWRLGGRWSLSKLKTQDSGVVQNVAGELRLDTNFRTTRARFFHQGLTVDAETRPLPEINAVWRDEGILLQADNLDLPELNRLVGDVMPSSSVARMLSELAPQGRIVQGRALWQQGQSALRAHLKLDNIGVQASATRAGAQGVSGDLWLQDRRALLRLASPSLSLALPTVYTDALQIDNVRADLYAAWTDDALYLRSDNIQGLASLGATQGKLALTLPLMRSSVEPEMELYLAVPEGDVSARNTVIPITVSPNLQGWLDTAIGDAQASDFGFIYRGSLLKEARDARSLGLVGRIHSANLKFLPEWPELRIDSALLVMDDEQTGIWLEQGGLPGIRASSVGAEVWLDQERLPHLRIDGAIAASLAGALSDLRESPLSIYIPAVTQDWRVQGTVSGRLQIQTPLVGATRPEVDLTLALDGVGMTPVRGLQITELAGALSYNTAQGFYAESLRASLWDRPLALHISGQEAANSTTEIHFSAALEGSSLETFLDLGIHGRLQGEAQVDGAMVLSSERASLTISSDLKGLAMNLPEPLSKQADVSWPLNFDLDLRSSNLRGGMTLGPNINLAAQLAPQDLGFAVGFGRQPLPLEAGLSSLTGTIKTLDLDAWRSIMPPSQESSTAHVLVQDLRVSRLTFMGREVNDVLLMADRKPSEWFVGWQLDWLKGELSSHSQDPHWRLHLLDIDLERIPSDWMPEQGGGEASELTWPELSVSVDRVRRGDQVLGHGDLRFEPSDTDYRLSAFDGEWRGLRVDPDNPIVLSWPRQGLITSRAAGGLLVDNLGDVFQAFGYESVLVTRSGRADFDLAWPGGPELFGFAGTDGQLKIRLKEGKFLKASAGAQGALKVITILNFTDIVSRLSLTQLFESGVPFDRLVIDATADLGLIKVDKLTVESSASRFQFSGQANLLDESLDGRLIATLPVANNLPWLAALTGGLPAAAGVYLISKIFEKQVDKFSSAVYSVKGTWQEPVLKFDTLFDTTLPKPKGSAEDTRVMPQADSQPSGGVSQSGAGEDEPVEAPADSSSSVSADPPGA